MSSVASPFGLKPAFKLGGTPASVQLASTIASGLASNIFQYSPVAVAANGTLTPAAPGSRIVGAFMGVEFTDTDGRRRVSNRWTANTVATEIVAYYTEDPYLVYEIQADGSIAQTEVGQQYDWTALGGNATTGLSNVALDTASAAANAGLRIIGVNPAPDNIFGDAFTIVQVQISEHQYVADQASV